MVVLKDIALFSAPNRFEDSYLWQNKQIQPVLLCPVGQTILKEPMGDGSVLSVLLSLLNAGGREPLSQLELQGALQGGVTELTASVLLLCPKDSRYTKLRMDLMFP